MPREFDKRAKARMVLRKATRLLPATAALSCLLLTQQAHADMLALWNFQDVVAASSVAGNLSAAAVTILSGTIGYQNGTDDGGTRIANASRWSTNAFATSGKYIQFSVAPVSGYEVHVTNVSIRLGRTAVGPVLFTAQYSLDGFATAGTLAGTGTVASEDTGALDSFILAYPDAAQTGTVTYRVWGHDAPGAGNMRFNNFRVHGSVNTQAPPPSAPVVQAGDNIGGDRFDANWSAVSEADGYRLDVSTNHVFSTFLSGYQNRDVGSVIAYTVTGLVVETDYYYRVRAYDAGSTSGDSATQQVHTALKGEPSNHATGFGAALTTHRTIVLEWTEAVGDELPDGYIVRGSTNGYTDIPVPADGSSVGNLSTWNPRYAHRVEYGEQRDQVSGQDSHGLIPGHTYYFMLFPVTNSGTNSLYKTGSEVPQLSVTTLVDVPFEDFERGDGIGSKTSYANALDVILQSGVWRLGADVLIGSLDADHKCDQRALRIRNLGSVTMMFDVTAVETVSLEHANFSSDTGGRVVVERSIDGGATWQPLGDEVVCGEALQTATFTVHRLAAFRLRIRKTAVADDESRINIDNIRFTPFAHDPSVFRFR